MLREKSNNPNLKGGKKAFAFVDCVFPRSTEEAARDTPSVQLSNRQCVCFLGYKAPHIIGFGRSTWRNETSQPPGPQQRAAVVERVRTKMVRKTRISSKHIQKTTSHRIDSHMLSTPWTLFVCVSFFWCFLQHTMHTSQNSGSARARAP